MHTSHGGKQGFWIERPAPDRVFQLMRQHIEQHFRIGIGVDMAQIQPEQLFLQLLGVGQIAIVRQHQAERQIDVKRLRFG